MNPLALSSLFGGLVGGISSIFGGNNTASVANQNLAQQQQQLAQTTQLENGQIGQYIGNINDYKNTANQQIGQTRQDNNTALTNAFNNINNIIKGIPSVSNLFGAANDLSQADWASRSADARSNLQFDLGGPAGEASAFQNQANNEDIANLNFGHLNNSFNNIVKSSLLGLNASTFGGPTGEFSNLSAQNMQAFSQQGISNMLAEGDFFAQKGTVDPISPLKTAFDLQQIATGQAQMGINNNNTFASGVVNSNLATLQDYLGVGSTALGAQGNVLGQQLAVDSNNLNVFRDISNAGIQATANQNASFNTGIGQIFGGITNGFSLNGMQNSLNNYTSFGNNLVSRYGSMTPGMGYNPMNYGLGAGNYGLGNGTMP